MKILLLSPFYKPDNGGVESHLEKLINYKKKYPNIHFTLITYNSLNSDKKGKKYESFNNTAIYRISWFGKGWFSILEKIFLINFFYLFPGLLIKSLWVFQIKKPDIIHAHGIIAGVTAIILKKIFNVKIIISTHTIYNFKSNLIKFIFKLILKNFDKILCFGEPSLQEVKKTNINNDYSIFRNWVEIKKFSRVRYDIYKKKYQKKKFIVLFVGRMIKKKGVLLLLNIAKKCKKKDIQYFFVGSGPVSDIIESNSKIYKNIRYFKKVNDNNLLKIYKISSIFVAPVLYDEGPATVCLEAIASGIPVITADRGCLPYILNKKVSILLKPVNEINLYNAILRYKKKFKHKNYNVNVCKDFAKKNFSEKNAKIIFDNYYKLNNTSIY